MFQRALSVGGGGGSKIDITKATNVSFPYGTWYDTGVSVNDCQAIYVNLSAHGQFICAEIDGSNINYLTESTALHIKVDNGTIWTNSTISYIGSADTVYYFKVV